MKQLVYYTRLPSPLPEGEGVRCSIYLMHFRKLLSG